MSRKPCFQLICISIDGSIKREGRDYTSIHSAWERNEAMGSRWVFFPLRVIAGPTGKRIVSVPSGMSNEWVNHSIAKLCNAIKHNQEDVLKWLEGKIPCSLYPWDKIPSK